MTHDHPNQTHHLTPGWAVYLRTNTIQPSQPDSSKERQRLTIQLNILNRSDLPIYAEYTDDMSGVNPPREAFKLLLADARAGKFSHVVVERADRFGRNPEQALRAIEALDRLGITVKFANAPDVDLMNSDDRLVVALTFSRMQYESMRIAMRVKSAQKAKRAVGGYCGKAPDGYRNRREGTHAWIEPDPERAELWQAAWALLLTGTMRLQDIAFTLHENGYRHRSGKPFILNSGSPVTTGLLRAFQDWTYAGWVVHSESGIAPKTVRGQWQPLVSTEDFELGLAILEQLGASSR